MTLQGTKIEHDAGSGHTTLDLTAIKLSFSQTILMMVAIGGIISMSAISVYQLSELRSEVVKQTAALSALSSKVSELELDKARRDGIIYGRANPEGKTP